MYLSRWWRCGGEGLKMLLLCHQSDGDLILMSLESKERSREEVREQEQAPFGLHVSYLYICL